MVHVCDRYTHVSRGGGGGAGSTKMWVGVHVQALFTHICFLDTHAFFWYIAICSYWKLYKLAIMLPLLPMWLLSSLLTGPGIHYTMQWKTKSWMHYCNLCCYIASSYCIFCLWYVCSCLLLQLAI